MAYVVAAIFGKWTVSNRMSYGLQSLSVSIQRSLIRPGTMVLEALKASV